MMMTRSVVFHWLTNSLHKRKQDASRTIMDCMHVLMHGAKTRIHSCVNKEESVNVPKNIMAVANTWKLKIYWRRLNSNLIQPLNSKTVSSINLTIWLVILWVFAIRLLIKLRVVKQIICLIWVKLIVWKNQRLFMENYCQNMWIFRTQQMEKNYKPSWRKLNRKWINSSQKSSSLSPIRWKKCWIIMMLS